MIILLKNGNGVEIKCGALWHNVHMGLGEMVAFLCLGLLRLH